MNRKRFENELRDLSEEEEIAEAEGEEDKESSSEITQSTRGTREWKRHETTQHRPKALPSPILLKIERRIESGRWSKWDCGSENVKSDITKKRRLVCDPNSLGVEAGLV
ncbi:hypothetical protein CMV_018626 [Castanea mollissima]|uniref:Uncharacterized protein n=1 Tax=Castanea mollissima TaxID=60419 RepID=A0A8J4VPF5_9ROSI|nr:hypothetical protein CMV_018626 [Castanea mollissima]